jgi:hypothetical protein
MRKRRVYKKMFNIIKNDVDPYGKYGDSAISFYPDLSSPVVSFLAHVLKAPVLLLDKSTSLYMMIFDNMKGDRDEDGLHQD